MDESGPLDEVWWTPNDVGVRIGVLGPVRLDVDGVEQPLTARRQRAVLACLALHAGEAVSADRLLYDVWGPDARPSSGVKVVAYQISQLRDRLGAHDAVIATTTAGYRLDLDRDRIDALVSDELIDRARVALPSDPFVSEKLVERAIGLRRGRPFADLDDVFVELETHRLDDRHVVARRTLAEARLAQGRVADAIGDLSALLAEQPLDEAVVTMLMTALACSGRSADALRVFDEFRRRLGAELGIEPSGQIRRLEQRILDGDAGLRDVGDAHIAGATGNLPTPLSSFVGRDDEIDELVTLLSTARLVTLTSFGGAGKTRLAIEVASRLHHRFADGVWFVDLVPISDPVLLAETIIASTGISPTGVHDTESYLRSEMAHRDALIVVDNCEHLAAEVGALIGRVLRDAPSLRVLATSRVSLGVPGELVWNVPPLTPETAGYELFVQRGEQVRSASVANADRAVITEICERLDGIPLAIELASARLRIMTIDQIVDHLTDRFGLLVSTERHADDRQRSLLAMLSWTYDILEPPERRLFGRVASCVDGFNLDAAVALGEDTPLAVVDRLERLVGAGLVTFTDRSGTGRYSMSETVRDFVAGMLSPDDRLAAGQAHARYYATVAESIAEMEATGANDWLQLGDRELGNLRAAMGWAFAHGQARVGMAMAKNLWRYFYEQATGSNENVRWGRLALDQLEEDDDDVMFVAAGTLIEAYNLNDLDASEVVAERIRRGLDSVQSPAVRSRAIRALVTSIVETDPRAADAYYDEAWLAGLAPRESIAILANQVEASWLTGELDEPTTIARLHEVAAATTDRPDFTLKVEAGVAACAGRWNEVLRLTESPVAAKVQNDLHLLRIEALAASGRFEEALALSSEPHLDDYWADMQRIRLIGAAIELTRGDGPAALERLQVVVRSTQLDPRRLALSMHVAALLAAAVHQCGHEDEAAMLFGFAAAERERLRINLRLPQRAPVADAEHACRATLGTARFEELARMGASTSWHTLVDEVSAATLPG